MTINSYHSMSLRPISPLPPSLRGNLSRSKLICITILPDCRQTLSRCVSRINEQLLITSAPHPPPPTSFVRPRVIYLVSMQRLTLSVIISNGEVRNVANIIAQVELNFFFFFNFWLTMFFCRDLINWLTELK